MLEVCKCSAYVAKLKSLMVESNIAIIVTSLLQKSLDVANSTKKFTRILARIFFLQ